MMEQTFEYPNLVAGTDAWSDWLEPAVGAENETSYIADVEFPRAIEADDVVCAGVEIEFDGLDLTASGAAIHVQGEVEGSWHYSNVVVRAINFGWPQSLPKYGAVLDGTYLISGVNVVSSVAYGTEWGMSPVGKTTFRFGFRVDNCGGGRLRARRLMVTLNGDGVPHAWAPAAGETISGTGELAGDDLIGGINPTLADGAKLSDSTYSLPANSTTGSAEQIKYAITGQSALTENQTVRVALSTKSASEMTDALLIAVAYEDDGGNVNSAIGNLSVGTDWARSSALVVVPSGMRVVGLSVCSAASAPETRIANPTLTYGGAVTLASAKHVRGGMVRIEVAACQMSMDMQAAACPISIEMPVGLHG